MRKKYFLNFKTLILILVFSLVAITETTAQVTMGGTGGTEAAQQNRIRMTVNAGGNFQVKYRGANQIFESGTDSPGTGNNVPGTLQGIIISIGNRYWSFGSLGDVYADDGRLITGYNWGGAGNDSNNVTNSAVKTGSSGGPESYTMTHTITKGGKQYVFTVTYNYPGTGTIVKATYSVQAPANNTDPIKVVHAWDTYLGGSDQGPGSYSGARGTPGELITVKNGCDRYQGFEYVSGTQWSGHYSAYYGAFQDELDGDMTFNGSQSGGIVNSNSNIDNGVGISIDFGTPTSTVQSVNKLIFAPDQAKPTLSGTTANNSCPSAVVTEANLRALVSSNTTNIKFFTSSTPNASNEVSFPITSNTTVYAANSIDGCYYTVSDPISVQIVNCCPLSSEAAPMFSVTTLSNSCPTTTADLTSLTPTNTAPANATLTWFNATDNSVVNAPSAVSTVGNYYAAWVSTSDTSCKTPNSSNIAVSINTNCCPLSSEAAPTFSVATLSNSCPTTTANLNSLTPTNAAPANATLTWFNATDNSVVSTPSAVSTAGNYYAAWVSTSDTSCKTPNSSNIAVSINTNCGAGTVDCSKTIMIPPTSGSGQYTLLVTIDVTTAGCISPVTVSGSGMSVANGVTEVCVASVGIQQVSIPLDYDGTTALGALTFTVGGQTCSTLDLAAAKKKKSVLDIWSLDNCSPVQVGPTLK